MSRWARHACISHCRLVSHALGSRNSGSSALPHVTGDYSQWNLQRCVGEHRFPSIALYTEKESFIRDNTINWLNNHIHAEETPHATVEQGHQRRLSVSGWGGIVRDFSKGCYWLLHVPQEQLQGISSSHCHKCGRMWRFASDNHVFHARRASTSLQHGHTRTSDCCFPSAVVFWRARSSDINFLSFLVWGRRRCLVYGAPAVTEDYLQTRIQAPCDNIHKQLICLNDSDSQPSYRPEAFNVVTNTHQKVKETREDYWRYFWMCDNVKGQQVAQLHYNYMMIHLLPIYHIAQCAAQCRISAISTIQVRGFIERLQSWCTEIHIIIRDDRLTWLPSHAH